MIKVMSITLDAIEKKAHVDLFADTKEEVTSDMTVDQIPEGYEIELGSSCITAAGDLGFMKSTGSWQWVGEGEEEPALVNSTSSLQMTPLTLKSDVVEEPLEKEVEEVVEETPEER